MGIIDRFEEEYLDVSSSHASVRSCSSYSSVQCCSSSVRARWRTICSVSKPAMWVAGGLVVIFAITLVSQAYWAVTGREDYEE